MRAILKAFGWLFGYGWLYGRRRRLVLDAGAGRTLDVIPLPPPANVAPVSIGPTDPADLEGNTVRAPMSHEEAYEMHARYAPSFDQQVALHRYVEQHGDDGAVPEAMPEHGFDQHRYASALHYGEAFEAQLSERRRTAALQVAPPRRIARGSYTPQQYLQTRQRSDQPLDQWDTPKTKLGVHPLKK